MNAPRIENAGPAIGGVGDGPGLTGRQNLGAGISPGIPANRGANPERGGVTPILTPRTPRQITPETPRGGLGAVATPNAAAPTINQGPDAVGLANAAIATDLGLDANNIPALTPRTPGQIAADAPLNGQEGAATINAGIPDAAQRQTPDVVGPASAAVATDLGLEAEIIPDVAPRTPAQIAADAPLNGQEGATTLNDGIPDSAATPDQIGPGNAPPPLVTDLAFEADIIPDLALPTPRQVASDAPRSSQEGAAAISTATLLGGTGEDIDSLVGIENELDLAGAIVPLTTEIPRDAARNSAILPGLPDEENPGIATSLAREDAELFEAVRAPAAIGADLELRNTGENPQTIGAAAEEAFRVSQGPAEATGPVEININTALPEGLAGPVPVEADDREPEVTEEANNPEVAPVTAVAEGPAPAPETEAPTPTPDDGATLAAEPPAPVPGARPDETTPAGQEALVARAVAAFEAQQFEGRSDEPVETRALEELFI